MKKTLCAALAAAFAIGASATALAAANPFTDVPADHWAYDAVAQLAADGIVDGYGDGTYRGQQEITRYEMAQMTARAMAKNPSGADKALVDKLAAEFADELNSLGVRVSALEKKVDNVRWKGWVGYEYWSDKGHEGHDNSNLQRVQLQLNPTFTINQNWSARARLKYMTDMDSAKNITGADGSEFCIDRLWAIGNYRNLKVELGKVPYEGRLDKGLVFGNRLSGGIVTFGKRLKTSIGAGRQSRDPNKGRAGRTDSMQFIEMNYAANQKLNVGAAYYHVENKNIQGFSKSNLATDSGSSYGAKDRNIWELGLTYELSPLWSFNAAYAKNESGNWASKYNQAYTAEFSYNGGRYPEMKRGSFGGFVAYRHLGRGAAIFPTYDETYTYWNNGSIKGVNVGAAYAFNKSVLGTLLYFYGKDMGDHGDENTSTLYGALQFFF